MPLAQFVLLPDEWYLATECPDFTLLAAGELFSRVLSAVAAGSKITSHARDPDRRIARDTAGRALLTALEIIRSASFDVLLDPNFSFFHDDVLVLEGEPVCPTCWVLYDFRTQCIC